MGRKIIHIDMDAFFASVEQRDDPKLRQHPIAVGGNPNQRGVVATASYEARAFGIHSAMAMATAIRLCPQLIIIRPRIAYYRQIAEEIRRIFARFTDKIEPLSIDEAYLDVSDSDAFQGSATRLAGHIIDIINSELQLSASAGVSYCKFLAKYASGINKPHGIFTITPDDSSAIIADMPVEKFHGIGPATQKKLNQLQIFTGNDLRQANLQILRQHLGKMADFYYALSHGHDNREIRISRKRKSLGNETTFAKDLNRRKDMYHALIALIKTSWQDLANKSLLPLTITLKIKYQDFSLQSKSFSQTTPIYSRQSAEIIIDALLTKANPQQPVRLLGVSFSHFVSKHRYPIQRRLFND